MKVIFLDLDGVIVTNHYLTRLEQKGAAVAGRGRLRPLLPAVPGKRGRTGGPDGGKRGVVLYLAFFSPRPRRRPPVSSASGTSVRNPRRNAAGRTTTPASRAATPTGAAKSPPGWSPPEVTRYCILDDDPRILPSSGPTGCVPPSLRLYPRQARNRPPHPGRRTGWPGNRGSGNAPK
jgi:hypothetical protein